MLWSCFALVLRSAGLGGLGLAACAVHALCSRDIQVPVAPIGLSVSIQAKQVGGIYPEVLRNLSEREGCSFQFSVVPRARQELLFETGRADLLVPASRTPRRDVLGIFVPMISSRALIISRQGERPPLRSLAELLARRELRVVLVRGFDYGDAYQAMVRQLEQQGRLSLASDPLSVARMLSAGMADLTVMAPSVLMGALALDARARGLQDDLRYEAVEELPWGDSGIYVSRKSLAEADRQHLLAALERSSRSGLVWREFQRVYPPGSLEGSVRPR